MAAPPLNALAEFLGEAPAVAALRPGATRRSNPCDAPTAHGYREEDSSSDSDGVPCYDGGIDNDYDDGAAPLSNPAAARIRHYPQFDEPKNFDCFQPKHTIAEVAPKRSLHQGSRAPDSVSSKPRSAAEGSQGTSSNGSTGYDNMGNGNQPSSKARSAAERSQGMSSNGSTGYDSMGNGTNHQPARRSADGAANARVVAVRRTASQGSRGPSPARDAAPNLMATMTPEPDSYASFLGEKFSDQTQPGRHNRADKQPVAARPPQPPGFILKQPRHGIGGRA